MTTITEFCWLLIAVILVASDSVNCADEGQVEKNQGTQETIEQLTERLLNKLETWHQQQLDGDKSDQLASSPAEKNGKPKPKPPNPKPNPAPEDDDNLLQPVPRPDVPTYRETKKEKSTTLMSESLDEPTNNKNDEQAERAEHTEQRDTRDHDLRSVLDALKSTDNNIKNKDSGPDDPKPDPGQPEKPAPPTDDSKPKPVPRPSVPKSENKLSNKVDKDKSSLKDLLRHLLKRVDEKYTRTDRNNAQIDLEHLSSNKLSSDVRELVDHHKKLPEQLSSEPRTTASCGNPVISPTVTLARIVGGEEARPYSWPWQCRLVADLLNGYVSNCGASVLSNLYLLTAAHCIFDGETHERLRENQFTVYCGEHYRDKRDANEQKPTVERITVHENYNPKAVDYDVAVIKLSSRTPLTLNRYVQPICLPSTDAAAGTSCVVTGWGATQDTGSNNVLRQVVVPIISQQSCSRVVRSLTERMVCAGYERGGKDSCVGDSGGPFVCRRSGRWELQGVVSFGLGEKCAAPGVPGVYARVTQFLSWIQQKTGGIRPPVTGGGGGTSPSGPTSCPTGKVLCRGTGRCINRSYVCDGDNDCGDFADELICRGCKKGDYLCRNKKYCLPIKYLCNKKNECGDNSDEQGC